MVPTVPLRASLRVSIGDPVLPGALYVGRWGSGPSDQASRACAAVGTTNGELYIVPASGIVSGSNPGKTAQALPPRSRYKACNLGPITAVGAADLRNDGTDLVVAATADGRVHAFQRPESTAPQRPPAGDTRKRAASSGDAPGDKAASSSETSTSWVALRPIATFRVGEGVRALSVWRRGSDSADQLLIGTAKGEVRAVDVVAPSLPVTPGSPAGSPRREGPSTREDLIQAMTADMDRRILDAKTSRNWVTEETLIFRSPSAVVSLAATAPPYRYAKTLDPPPGNARRDVAKTGSHMRVPMGPTGSTGSSEPASWSAVVSGGGGAAEDDEISAGSDESDVSDTAEEGLTHEQETKRLDAVIANFSAITKVKASERVLDRGLREAASPPPSSPGFNVFAGLEKGGVVVSPAGRARAFMPCDASTIAAQPVQSTSHQNSSTIKSLALPPPRISKTPLVQPMIVSADSDTGLLAAATMAGELQVHRPGADASPETKGRQGCIAAAFQVPDELVGMAWVGNAYLNPRDPRQSRDSSSSAARSLAVCTATGLTYIVSLSASHGESTGRLLRVDLADFRKGVSAFAARGFNDGMSLVYLTTRGDLVVCGGICGPNEWVKEFRPPLDVQDVKVQQSLSRLVTWFTPGQERDPKRHDKDKTRVSDAEKGFRDMKTLFAAVSRNSVARLRQYRDMLLQSVAYGERGQRQKPQHPPAASAQTEQRAEGKSAVAQV